MPNWCYNSLTISHSDVDKVNALEKHIQDQIDAGNNNPDFFDFLRPNPDGKDAENWYDWNCANWGCKWDANDLQDLDKTDNELSFNFTTAWCPPHELYNYIHEQGWKFHALYEETGNGFCGIHDNDNGNCESADWDIPTGRRNCRRVLEDDDMPDELKDFIDIEGIIDRLNEEAEDDEDYESEDDEEEKDKQEELNDNLPITEASRIIATETPKLIKGYEGYCKHLLATAWKIYLKQNSEMYDEKWFAIIGVEKIYETLNWKWIVEQTNAKKCE